MKKGQKILQPLPCPFCGELPRVFPWHGGKPTRHMVECSSDDCYVSPSVIGETRREAILKWNERKP